MGDTGKQAWRTSASMATVGASDLHYAAEDARKNPIMPDPQKRLAIERENRESDRKYADMMSVKREKQALKQKGLAGRGSLVSTQGVSGKKTYGGSK